MKKKLVVALGRGALGNTFPEQKTAASLAAKSIADLVEAGYDVVISHSNAPQVGMIHTAMNEFGKIHPDYTFAPMSVCSAMSQGYIGYDLQNSIRSELLQRGIFRTVSTILTQVTVDPYDDALYNPSKPIGRYLTKEEADEEEKKGNYITHEPGRGYRRVVSAPKPKDIVEIDAIRTLADAGQIVIACGGGGIPVMEQNHKLRGASAVIEKDHASGRLAQLIDADALVILTSVEQVCLNYGTDHETPLSELSLAQARQYISEEQFGEGNMLPKIEASVAFIEEKKEHRTALITSLERARDGIRGNTGTQIHA